MRTTGHTKARREFDRDLLCSVVGTTAAIIGGALAATGAVAGSAISAHAASSAADKQATAADQIKQQAIDAGKVASDTVTKATADANAGLTSTTTGANQQLDAAKQQQLDALKPYIDAGQVSLPELQQLLGTNGPLGSQSNFSFTPQDWQNDPGFAYIQQQQQQGLDRSAAARGTLFSGGTAKATARLQSNLASTHLDDAFNRAIQTYDTNRQNVITRIQGLTGLTNTGLSATNTQNTDIGNTAQLQNQNTVGTADRIAANQIAAGTYVGNTGLRAADIAASATGAKAAAQGAGDIGVASAINSGISGAVRAFAPVFYGANTPGVKATGNTIGDANPPPTGNVAQSA